MSEEKPVITKEQMIADLQTNLGIQSGDLLAVHSSLKSIGKVEGGPVALIEALVEAVGGADHGTIAMPCFNHPAEVVDLRTTPCRLGLVPEAFRTYPGVLRSQNATHSVAAIGKDAAAILATHKGREALGPDSPFHEIAKRGGSILHIGCNMNSCSIIHIAEGLAGIPYQHISYPGYSGSVEVVVDDETRYSWTATDNPGDSVTFIRVQEEMDKRGLIRHGTVGMAECLLFSGADVLDLSVEMLKQNPYLLLCDNPRCPVCPERRQHLQALGK